VLDLGTCDTPTCSSDGFIGESSPNSCDNLDCTDNGGGAGQCTTGPDDAFCDGILQIDGRGVMACANNSDCAPELWGFDAGDCTHVERRRCFENSISATGAADPTSPVLASSYCAATSQNVAVNAIVGLPGAVRSATQETLSGYCLGNAAAVYTPGVGCP
jgi:hypothetical protein